MAIGFAVFIVLAGDEIQAQDWPQYGGVGSDFAAITDVGDKPAISELRIAWRAKVGPGNSGVSVLGNVAVASARVSDQEQVTALNANTGEELWTRLLPVGTRKFLDLEFGSGPHSSPLLTKRLVVHVGLTGDVIGLDIKTGETVWRNRLWVDGDHTELQRGFAASPRRFGNSFLLPVGGEGRSIRRIALVTGRPIWERHDFAAAYSSAVPVSISGRQQAVVLMDQALVGVDAESGKLAWTYPVPTESYVNCTAPIVIGDRSIVLSTCRGLRAIRVETAGSKYGVSELWSNRVRIDQTRNLLFQDGAIFASKEGGVFIAVDAKTGQTLWQSRAVKNCVVIGLSGSTVCAVDEQGHVIIADLTREGVRIKWKQKLLTGRCWASPTFGAGRIPVRDNAKLIAFDLEFQNQP